MLPHRPIMYHTGPSAVHLQHKGLSCRQSGISVGTPKGDMRKRVPWDGWEGHSTAQRCTVAEGTGRVHRNCHTCHCRTIQYLTTSMMTQRCQDQRWLSHWAAAGHLKDCHCSSRIGHRLPGCRGQKWWPKYGLIGLIWLQLTVRSWYWSIHFSDEQWRCSVRMADSHKLHLPGWNNSL